MSEDSNITDQRAQLAEAFDRDIDPLADFAPTFHKTDVDPFEIFEQEVLIPQDLTESTMRQYHSNFSDWRDYMAEQDRHPACPSESHVRGFIRRELDVKGHKPGTVQTKLQKLNKAYEYWQADNALPHPQEFNPFALARQKANLGRDDKKRPPNLSLETLREYVSTITHARDLAYIVLPLKLGLRAGELTNIQLQDIHIAQDDLLAHYDDMGTHPGLNNRENAIYIPTCDERDENKSTVPRVLPLDDESRRVLLNWLLIRPDSGSPWAFLTKQSHVKAEKDGVNDRWKAVFRPDFDETEEHRAITSHFGRHYFTSYWRVKQDAPRELVKYMRGDKTDGSAGNGREAIDEYLHTYYEDVEDRYREHIFKLNI